MAIDYGRPPKGGFAKLVSELLVEDLVGSLYFWREALGFEIAYQRPKEKFAYLERPEGAQVMLCERSEGRWETGPSRIALGEATPFSVTFPAILADLLQSI
jgi:hypothetical protein